jgi:hypothetical protein
MAGTVRDQAGDGDHSHHLVKKLQDTYCATATIKDDSCHDGHCHNTTSYIRDCDTYNGDNCDNFTTHFDICNATFCSNTSRRANACYSDVSDNCGNADLTLHCCSNGVCRNRTTHIHACYSDTAMNVGAGYSDFPFDYDLCGDRLIPSFANRIISAFRRRISGSGK